MTGDVGVRGREKGKDPELGLLGSAHDLEAGLGLSQSSHTSLQGVLSPGSAVFSATTWMED